MFKPGDLVKITGPIDISWVNRFGGADPARLQDIQNFVDNLIGQVLEVNRPVSHTESIYKRIKAESVWVKVDPSQSPISFKEWPIKVDSLELVLEGVF